MNITEYAIAKKLFGGGKREGTAIPADKSVGRIYFNTANTREQTNAILSQLTYIEGVMEYPINLIYVNIDENYEGDAVFAAKIPMEAEAYVILYMLRVGGVETTLFGMIDNSAFDNGWMKGYESYGEGSQNYQGAVGLQFMELRKMGQPLTDFMGMPVGAENEKIKNVLSITPF